MKRGHSSKRFCLIGLALFGAAVTFSHAVVYDAATDFSPVINPNGVWTYGIESPPGYGFNGIGDGVRLYDNNYFTDGNGLYVDGWADADVPNVTHNGTTGTVVYTSDFAFGSTTAIWQPGQLGFAPYGGFGIVRWTAPTSAVYGVSVQFTGLCSNVAPADICSNGTITDVHILLNGEMNVSGMTLFNGFVNGSGPGSGPSTNMILRLQAGDTVDFVVGGGSFCRDTGLQATITSIAEGSADLAVTAALAPGTTTTFSNAIYTITITNGGPNDAEEVLFTNTLPREIEYVACNAGTNASYVNASAGIVTAVFQSLPTGSSETMTITGQVRCSTLNRALLTNTTTVSSLTADPIAVNNLASLVTTNFNPSRKMTCADTLTFTETFNDVLVCSGSRVDGYDCSPWGNDHLTITVTIPLTGVDIKQFDPDTYFETDLGYFQDAHSFGDDPHYRPGRTSVTFVDTETDDRGRDVPYQIAHLSWSAKQLKVSMTGKSINIFDSSLGSIWAIDMDGMHTALLSRLLSGTVMFGPVNTQFDVVAGTGKIKTRRGIGPDGNEYSLSTINVKGAGYR